MAFMSGEGIGVIHSQDFVVAIRYDDKFFAGTYAFLGAGSVLVISTFRSALRIADITFDGLHVGRAREGRKEKQRNQNQRNLFHGEHLLEFTAEPQIENNCIASAPAESAGTNQVVEATPISEILLETISQDEILTGGAWRCWEEVEGAGAKRDSHKQLLRAARNETGHELLFR